MDSGLMTGGISTEEVLPHPTKKKCRIWQHLMKIILLLFLVFPKPIFFKIKILITRNAIGYIKLYVIGVIISQKRLKYIS